MTRSVAWSFVVTTVMLAASAEAVFAREMDLWSVLWLSMTAAVALAAGTVGTTSLAKAFGTGHLRHTFDQFYGLLFIVTPHALGFFGWAVLLLYWYFSGEGESWP